MPVPVREPLAERVLLRDEVRSRLRSAILDGTLVPGERLRDDELIAWLGVSRSPVREAINQLQVEGLIRTTPNRSTRVVEPRGEQISAVRSVLGTLFSGIVAEAVPVFSDDGRATVVSELERQLMLVADGRIDVLVRGAVQTYQKWIATCPNPYLAAIASATSTGLTYRIRASGRTSKAGRARLMGDLRDLRDAAARGDGIAAGAAMRAIHSADFR